MALAKISIMSIFTKSEELAASDIAAPDPEKKSKSTVKQLNLKTMSDVPDFENQIRI